MPVIMALKKWIALGALGLGSLAVYEFSFKSKAKLQTITILSEKKMLEIFSRIKANYKDLFKKHQKLFRQNRRKYQRTSQEYANTVEDNYASLPRVFNDAIDEVLLEFNISREIYENSWKLLKNQDQFFEAYEDVKTIMATGHPRNDLQTEVVRDALEFSKNKLESDFSISESLNLVVSQLEDEIKETYGFEMEEFEKAYYAYIDNFNDYDSIFQAIRDARAINENN